MSTEELEDIYGDGREALLDDDSLTSEEEGFMEGWDKALEKD